MRKTAIVSGCVVLLILAGLLVGAIWLDPRPSRSSTELLDYLGMPYEERITLVGEPKEEFRLRLVKGKPYLVGQTTGDMVGPLTRADLDALVALATKVE